MNREEFTEKAIKLLQANKEASNNPLKFNFDDIYNILCFDFPQLEETDISNLNDFLNNKFDNYQNNLEGLKISNKFIDGIIYICSQNQSNPEIRNILASLFVIKLSSIIIKFFF